MRALRTAIALGSLVAALPATAETGRWMEGTWARSVRDCRKEGFTSRTFIDLKDRKFGPLYDQYEHHCRITKLEPAGSGVTLRLTCHEFWDDFRARKNPQRETVVIQPGSPGTLSIGGAKFVRCRP